MKNFGRYFRRAFAIAIAFTMVVTVAGVGSATAGGPQSGWSTAGYDKENTRNQKTEHTIGVDNVGDLEVAWAAQTGGDVSATPAVDGDAVYFPDWAGNLFKLDRDTGQVIWQRTLEEYTGIAGNFSRTTPAIKGDLLIFGDQAGRQFQGAHMMAIDKHTGDLVWLTQVDTHPAAIITASAGLLGDQVFVGVSSLEEFFATSPGYQCCTFRGSLVALDANTGEISWQTYMVPEGFSGNAVWGSTPTIDTKRNSVYVATGNNYSAPDEFLECVAAAGDDQAAQRACLDPYPDNYFDAIVSMDLDTGEVNWARLVIPFDVWTVECLFGLPGCPDPEGPDFDFGQAPMLYNTKIGKKKVAMLGVGQKSGVFWSLDPSSGEIYWSTQVSPGGVAGGMMWGSAFDGERIYTSSANSQSQTWDLVDGVTTTAGIWSSLDPATGEIIWQTANPTGGQAGGAVTVANGVTYVCSQDATGVMYGLDSATGDPLWQYASGGSCNAGAAVVGGTVYWGSGYAGFGPPNTGNNIFYAFELP